MKRKIFTTTMFAMLVTVMSFANQTNAPQGAINVFEKYYGQTIESDVRGANDALLYIDHEIADGKIPEALLNLGYTVTVAVDWYDFTNKLNIGDYGLAVGFNQNLGWGAWKAGLIAAFQNYIANGGAVVFNDWTLDNDFATLFQTSFTGNTNQTIMHLDASIEENVSNPIILTNAGWTIFSTGLDAQGGAQVLATFNNVDDAIVKGNNGKTIILGYLTDAPAEAYRQQLFENLFQSVAPPPPPPVPVSNWALYLGILLMITFVVIRFRRMI